MKIATVLTLALLSACAGSTTASRDTTATSATVRGQSCAAPLVSTVAHKGSEVYAGPDGNSTLVATLKNDTPVCADSTSHGFGYRRVQLSDGRTGFVADQSISGG